MTVGSTCSNFLTGRWRHSRATHVHRQVDENYFVVKTEHVILQVKLVKHQENSKPLGHQDLPESTEKIGDDKYMGVVIRIYFMFASKTLYLIINHLLIPFQYIDSS